MSGPIALALVAACLLVPPAGAQRPDVKAYPAKPVRMVIPFAPGGGTDIVGRIVAQKLTEAWPYPVVVDNRPGAGSTIGTELVARATPDGYTIETVSMSHSINVSLYRKLPYDPVRDFATVILVAMAPNVLVVHPSLPARSLKELIAYAKSRPGQLNFASSGSGGVSHLSAELLKSVAGIDIVHVPYKGAGPAMTALIGGEVQMMMATAPVALAQMRANRVRALAISSGRRSSLAPDLPTIAESGFPGFQTDTWYGVVAPAGTPAAIVARLNAEIGRVLASPDARALLEAQGAHPAGGSPEEFRAFLRSEIAKWAKVIAAAGIKPL
jgi:tripartite-type tricarboxylate transporter receptor subunit TctC